MTVQPFKSPHLICPRRTALAAAMAVAGGPAWSQAAFPGRSVRLVVPFAPGGFTDIMARITARQLVEAWAQPVVVDNRPGGNAFIGVEAVAKSPPDGHALLAVTVLHAVNVSLYPATAYDLLRDFATVSVLGSLPLVVCVNPRNPATDLAGLMQQLRTRSMSGGSSGNGSALHVALEVLRQATGGGPNLIHVPYRGGAPAVADLVAGTLDLMVCNLPECIEQIRAGRLKALAVTGPERHRMLPGVPTVSEAGVPQLGMTNWTALLAPAAVPQPILDRIGADTMTAARQPEFRQRAEDAGFDVLGWDAVRSRAFLETEIANWQALIRSTGVRADG